MAATELELFPALPVQLAPTRPDASAQPPRKTVTRGVGALSLDLSKPSRVRFGCQVRPRPEDPAVYEAVLALRRAGLRVHRVGANHRVGESHLSTEQLLERAAVVRATINRR